MNSPGRGEPKSAAHFTFLVNDHIKRSATVPKALSGKPAVAHRARHLRRCKAGENELSKLARIRTVEISPPSTAVRARVAGEVYETSLPNFAGGQRAIIVVRRQRGTVPSGRNQRRGRRGMEGMLRSGVEAFRPIRFRARRKQERDRNRTIPPVSSRRANSPLRLRERYAAPTMTSAIQPNRTTGRVNTPSAIRGSAFEDEFDCGADFEQSDQNAKGSNPLAGSR